MGSEPDRSLVDRAKVVLNLEKGSPKIIETCMSSSRQGGIVSVVGTYATPFENFPVGQFFDKSTTIRGGQAPVQKHIDKLLQYIIDGKAKLDIIITHHMPLADAAHGYDIFRN